MTKDHYMEATELARLLEQNGLVQEGESLRRAISDGATATEILMALRWNLARIAKPTTPVPLEIRQRIEKLWAELDTLLKA